MSQNFNKILYITIYRKLVKASEKLANIYTYKKMLLSINKIFKTMNIINTSISRGTDKKK